MMDPAARRGALGFGDVPTTTRPRRRHRKSGSALRRRDLVAVDDKFVLRRRKPFWMRLRRLVRR
jgi:hypothetical protein